MRFCLFQVVFLLVDMNEADVGAEADGAVVDALRDQRLLFGE